MFLSYFQTSEKKIDEYIYYLSTLKSINGFLNKFYLVAHWGKIIEWNAVCK